ncbi:MAG: hypothetical protein KDC98_16030, partial [Planctomycetes bacterium]|nr:hypothetical protein [Planctomycetota bacterium]
MAGLVLTGCNERAVSESQLEIAAELRALRVTIQDAQSPGPTRPAADATAAARDLAIALDPLREVLTALVADMAEMQTRQASLAGELQRWSQLLAQTATGANRDEAAALAARLEALEQVLRQQDSRHREVEAMIGGALEKTSERLESFLQRIEGIAEPAAEARTGTPTNETTTNGADAGKGRGAATEPEAPEAASGGGQTGTRLPDDANSRQVRANTGLRRAGNPDTSLWWFGVAAAAILAG